MSWCWRFRTSPRTTAWRRRRPGWRSCTAVRRATSWRASGTRRPPTPRLAIPDEPADDEVRGTADNPFPDPEVIGAGGHLGADGGFDYVGTSGYPLGIAAEVARASALETAARDASAPAEREHVMPFLYGHPERFRVGSLPAPAAPRHSRYTVDTQEDLAFARALAARIGHPPPVRLAELEAIVAREPDLADLNADVRQKHWQEVEP
jgi:spore coat polysaccharide biosynthesis protein SpsF